MLRQLIRNFEYALRLHPTVIRAPIRQAALFGQMQTRPKKMIRTFTVSSNTTVNPGEVDHEYVPYCTDNETGTKANVLIAELRQRFRLSESEVQRIMSDEHVHRNYRGRSLTLTLNTLQLVGVTKKSFIEYPWLMSLDSTRLKPKLDLIESMNIQDINHFVPFLRLTVPRLRKLVTALNAESSTTTQQNRVYYISEKLEVKPEIVTKYLSKRLFILEMPFEMFEKNLQHMVNYNVSPINILKDLWAFRYTPNSVQLRLERAKRAKKDKIMPWMVRCPEPILQRSLKLTLDELKVLGDFSSVVEYLSDRLGFSVTETKSIMDKHPQVHTVRVTKIKEVLDYLLDEVNFTRFEIAQVPRILCHSLKTTRARFEELKSLGCRPTSLVILCRSRREYDKFLQQWRSTPVVEKSVDIHSRSSGAE